MLRKVLCFATILMVLPTLLSAQATRTIVDADIPVGAQVTFHSDTTYVLSGLVFVDSLAVLTIEPGTVIKGEDGQDINASGLVVTRYGKIFAEGTADRPIIFTSINDDLNGSLISTDPVTGALVPQRGEWAGVVLLGRASTNNQTPDGLKQVEGVGSILPAGDRRGLYGGTEDEHSSGVFRYVSIRHTGVNVGDQSGNEIQGLTLGGVGSGTTIEYVESFGSADDGFEFFGGTVNTRNLVSAFNEDDSYDYDEGFRGKGQFWFAIQAPDKGGRVAEQDGATGDEFYAPYAIPQFSNMTYIGAGVGALMEGDGSQMLIFRDNAGGKYYNSIFTDYDAAAGGAGITVEDIDNTGSKTEDSRKRLEAGDLVLSNNVWYDFGDGNDLASIAPQDFVQAHLSANNNSIVDPQLRGISREPNNQLDPRPAAGSPALSGAVAVADDWFVQTSYKGAFSAGNNWLQGWTALSQLGYLAEGSGGSGATRTIVDADIPVGAQVTFHSDTTYVLSGLVFVDSLAVLTIEPGTVIKGEDGQDINASGLVVTRYGKIFAEGTADRPIIFTSINDDLNGSLISTDPVTGALVPQRGEWAGVVLLGRASTNNQTPDGLKQVEGVGSILPAGDRRGLYGGTEDEHSSGVFRYVSIRHTGVNVGDQSGNEIQGLTLGGVGSGTTIEYVESFGSADDGFEFFGGTVNTRNLVSAFNEDDSYDYDEGFRGKGQFWFAIQAPDKGGRVAEQDGATGDEFYAPYAIPQFSNMTYIGAGVGALMEGDGSQMLIFRDNAGGKYYNSIFTDYDAAAGGAGITVEDIDNTGSKTEDSRKRLEAGDLVLSNNVWYDFGDGNDLASIAPQDFVQAHLSANNNSIVDPQLRGISREPNNQLDPRPAAGSPALSGAVAVADDWFVQTSYKGAFSAGNNWLQGWTALSQLGYTPDVVSSVEEEQLPGAVPTAFELSQNYPNPFNPSTNIQYSIAKPGHVKLIVYNQIGQQVATLIDGVRQAGQYTVTWQAESVASGLYFYRLQANGQTTTRRMMLVR